MHRKTRLQSKEIGTSCFIHRLKSTAADDDFLKGDLYEAWFGALDESILDENFEELFDEHVKEFRTKRLNINCSNI